MMKSAQASTERLMVMGYALVSVLIVVGALAYFDILTPSKFMPEKCVLGGALKCSDFQLQFQTVRIKIENTLARDMAITKVELFSKDLEGENCSIDTAIVLKPMASSDVEINDCAFTSEGKKKARLNIIYHYGTGLAHEQGGELVLQVDNPYTPSGSHADSCTDEDNLNYYNQGEVSGFYNNVYYNEQDYCNDTDKIRINEYYCEGAYANLTKYTCPNGCKVGFGKCKDPDACEDSDGGKIYEITGTISGNFSGYPFSNGDVCLDENMLTEFFCSGAKANATNYTCLYGCSGTACNPVPGDSCEDTDGGKDYNVNGSIFGNANSTPYSLSDTCVNTTLLTEFFCSGASAQSENHTCSYGCLGGKCNAAPGDSCLDSDGGLVYNMSGTVTGNYNGSPYNYPDSCYNTTNLKEYFCSGISSNFTTYACTYGCLGGKCNATPASCIGDLDCSVYATQGSCEGCSQCSYTAESCSGTANLCNTFGSQSNCELCGCTWGVSTIQKVGGDVAGYVDKGTGSQAVSLPSGLQAGDIVIVAVSSDDILTNDGVQDQGYTNIPRGANELPGRKIAYKLMSPTPDTIVNIERVDNNRSAYVIQAWRGVDLTNVFDVATPTEATGTTGDPNSPAITPLTAGVLVIAIGMQDDDDSTVTSHPTGYTNGVSANTGQVPASTVNGTTIAMASKTWSSGAEDPSVWVMSGSDYWAATTIALRPASGCSGTPNTCAIGTCEATCGCSYTASSCSNSGSCATCPVGNCDSCSVAGCSLS